MDILLFMPSHNNANTSFNTFGKPDEHYKSVAFLLAFYVKRICISTAERGSVGPGGGPSVRPDRRTGGPSVQGVRLSSDTGIRNTVTYI